MAAISLPLFAIAAVLIKLDDGGPVFYKAARIGRGGLEFKMYKFRTMLVNAEALGGSSTPADDPRLTKAGRQLRRFKLDEFPQFLNVLRGDMSIVGPRPQVPSAVMRYTQEERRLLTVRPGITDWASIRFRNEDKILADQSDPDEAYELLIKPEKIRLGLLYIDKASTATDVRILADTVRGLFSRSTDNS